MNLERVRRLNNFDVKSGPIIYILKAFEIEEFKKLINDCCQLKNKQLLT
jgi:hypothetical protein